MTSRILRSALAGQLEEEITEEQARVEIEHARSLGEGCCVGELESAEGAVCYTPTASGGRIAPIHFWRHRDGDPPPQWHVNYFAQFRSQHAA